MTQTPQIALIGTEGSGKTVLTTVLAKELSQATSNGLCMIPIGAKTAKYIESAWETLQSGEWLPSTPAGKLFALHWKLKIGNQQAEMKLIDSAGQDLRKLFSDAAYQDPNLPEQDKLLIEYIRSSSILIILINLRDFIAEKDIGLKIESQMSLKEALEFVNKDNDKQVAVVLPQYDEYRTIIQKRYGSDNAFIQQELPYLYNSQASNWKENLFPVAAVNDTEMRSDRDGRTRKVPKPGFGSAGLDQLIQWLGNALQTALQHIEAERQMEEARQLEEERQRQKEKKRRQWAKFEKKIVEFFWRAAVVAGILFVAYLVYLGSGIVSRNLERRQKERERIAERIQKERERIAADAKRQHEQLMERLAAAVPQPELCKGDENKWFWYWDCSRLFVCLEHRATAKVAVHNNGHAGIIRVTFSVNGREGFKDTWLNANESKWVNVTVYDLPNHSSDQVQVELSVPGATKGEDGQWRSPQKQK